MSKKNFTDPDIMKFAQMSDTELVEELNTLTGLSPAVRDIIIALLDLRFKKVTNHLKEITEKSVDSTDKFNQKLIVLTRVLVWLTVMMTLVGIVQICILVWG